METPINALKEEVGNLNKYKYKVLKANSSVVDSAVSIGIDGDISTEIDISSYTLKDMYSVHHSLQSESLAIIDGFMSLEKYYNFNEIYIIKYRTASDVREDIIGVLCPIKYDSDQLLLLELFTDCLSVDYSRKGASSCQILKCKYKEENMLLLTDIHFY